MKCKNGEYLESIRSMSIAEWIDDVVEKLEDYFDDGGDKDVALALRERGEVLRDKLVEMGLA